MKKWTILATLALGITIMGCESQAEEEELEAGIHAEVMFMNYPTNTSSTMVMGYLWTGDSWSSAEMVDGSAKMFSVAFAGGDTLAGTYDVEFEVHEEGTYYFGCFETSGMMYDTKVATCGFYNAGETNMNSMMTPSGVSVTESKDYHLETMMVMGGM